LDIRFDATGQAIKSGFLRYLDSVGLARAAVHMRAPTTINDPNDIDAGYSVEIALNLRAFGYPAGLGDRALFLGATLFDHDAFLNPSDDYGTRTWFMREHDRVSAPAWCDLSVSTMVTGVSENVAEVPGTFVLHGNYPNPFNPSTVIAFSLPSSADVVLEVTDLLGRSVHASSLGGLMSGRQEIRLDATAWSTGVYLYRLSAVDRSSGRQLGAAHGKLVLMK
jgi:hypothetical protein